VKIIGFAAASLLTAALLLPIQSTAEKDDPLVNGYEPNWRKEAVSAAAARQERRHRASSRRSHSLRGRRSLSARGGKGFLRRFTLRFKTPAEAERATTLRKKVNAPSSRA